jgi:hypothetical protein
MTRLFDKYNLGLLFLSFFFSTALFAQKTGSISGIVIQKNTQLNIYATNYNILRIDAGISGILYAN